ncbi:hypothetical protein JAAARDRAFT_487146 [Jaapia argillacea MUCL 33604]|uniref:Uncharacterized protein n=1 Tax=Jaapia argillacea MUCL 33604 TaxID=933084 RepID=A0A067PEJ7_9AGAM|nr:hypothetical protein JAAARDRAFT_487146 [Jaapia argillacea MUCL 33604]
MMRSGRLMSRRHFEPLSGLSPPKLQFSSPSKPSGFSSPNNRSFDPKTELSTSTNSLVQPLSPPTLTEPISAPRFHIQIVCPPTVPNRTTSRWCIALQVALSCLLMAANLTEVHTSRCTNPPGSDRPNAEFRTVEHDSHPPRLATNSLLVTIHLGLSSFPSSRQRNYTLPDLLLTSKGPRINQRYPIFHTF